MPEPERGALLLDNAGNVWLRYPSGAWWSTSQRGIGGLDWPRVWADHGPLEHLTVVKGDQDTAAGILAGLIATVSAMQTNAQARSDAYGSAHLAVCLSRLQRAAAALERATGADALQRDAFHNPVDRLVDDAKGPTDDRTT